MSMKFGCNAKAFAKCLSDALFDLRLTEIKSQAIDVV